MGQPRYDRFFLDGIKNSIGFFRCQKKKESILTVRLQPELKMRLGAVPEGMGIQASTLARMWLVENYGANSFDFLLPPAPTARLRK